MSRLKHRLVQKPSFAFFYPLLGLLTCILHGGYQPFRMLVPISMSTSHYLFGYTYNTDINSSSFSTSIVETLQTNLFSNDIKLLKPRTEY